MSNQAPLVDVIEHSAQPVATAGNDLEEVITASPFAGSVTSVTYATETAITGAATNTRSVTLYNRKADGSGSAVVATLEFDAGINTVAYVEKAITLSATPANLVLAAGDVLTWKSAHVGTGLADPGGRVEVTVSRS